VNEHDEPVGVASIKEAQEKGLIHRIARVMVEDKAGNVLLQKRVLNSSLFPGRWDNSAAGHVDAGESYHQAAERELSEEIGLKGVKLKEIGYYHHKSSFEDRKLDRFCRVYKVTVSPDQKFDLQPEEVSEVRWFTQDEVKDLITEHPEQITDGVLDVFRRFYP